MATESRNKTKVSKKRTIKIEGIRPSILNSSKIEEEEEEALIRAQIKFSRERKKKESLLANILTHFF
jgi:hypothetical protein